MIHGLRHGCWWSWGLNRHDATPNWNFHFGLIESDGMTEKVLVAARLPPRRSFSVQSDTGFATGRLRPSFLVWSGVDLFASHMSFRVVARCRC